MSILDILEGESIALDQLDALDESPGIIGFIEWVELLPRQMRLDLVND